MSAGPDGPPPRQGGAPRVVRVAGVLIGVEGMLGVVFAGYLVARSGAGSLGMRAALGSAATFLLLGAALVAVGVGLLRGGGWARTPGIVAQLLLLLVVVYSLGPSDQVLAGLVAGVVVLAGLLSLLSEPARRWSADLDEARRGG